MPASTIERSRRTARDESLLERGFVQKDAWAFEAAYQEYKGLLFSTAMHVLGAREEAEDCVHDVLVRLWRSAHPYRTERGSLRAFLAVCVRNEALSRQRKRHNRARIERENLSAEIVAAPDDRVVDRDRVARALAALGEQAREAVRLAYEEDLPYQEIAQRLNEPLGTIKSRLSNAVRTLREQFALQGELP